MVVLRMFALVWLPPKLPRSVDTHPPAGRYPGSAYIDFPLTESAQGAMQQHQVAPLALGDRVITVYYAQPSFTTARPDESHYASDPVPQSTSERQLNPPMPSIFVTKFAKPVLERDIREAFNGFGDIQSIALSA